MAAKKTTTIKTKAKTTTKARKAPADKAMLAPVVKTRVIGYLAAYRKPNGDLKVGKKRYVTSSACDTGARNWLADNPRAARSSSYVGAAAIHLAA